MDPRSSTKIRKSAYENMASHDSFSKPAAVCYKFDNQIPTHTGTQTIKDTAKGSKPRGRPPMFVNKKGNQQTFLAFYFS